MKSGGAILTLAVFLIATASSESAFARRGGGHSGHHHHRHAPRVVILGGAAFAPLYYPPGFGYYAPMPAYPPAYIEPFPAPAAPAQQPSYWYYCAASNAYYPYVQDCPGGWQPVLPQPR